MNQDFDPKSDIGLRLLQMQADFAALRTDEQKWSRLVKFFSGYTLKDEHGKPIPYPEYSDDEVRSFGRNLDFCGTLLAFGVKSMALAHQKEPLQAVRDYLNHLKEIIDAMGVQYVSTEQLDSEHLSWDILFGFMSFFYSQFLEDQYESLDNQIKELRIHIFWNKAPGVVATFVLLNSILDAWMNFNDGDKEWLREYVACIDGFLKEGDILDFPDLKTFVAETSPACEVVIKLAGLIAGVNMGGITA